MRNDLLTRKGDIVQLSEQIAFNIVREVNLVIPMKINIMNADGIIIASSNPARIGQFHEAAYHIVSNKIDELTVRYDGEFEGTLKGINYSLKLQGLIVGVLGITGEYEEIAKDAQIIKRMTELLLENTYSVEQKQIRENVCNRYLAEWLHGEPKNINSEFVERGRLLGFDITIPRRIIVCSFYRNGREIDLDSMQLIEQAEKFLKKMVAGIDPLNLYYKSSSKLVSAVTAIKNESINALAIELKAQVEKRFDVKLAIGIDSMVEDYTNIQTALKRAQKANRACLPSKTRGIQFYDTLCMEVFTDEISELSRIEFIHRIFRGFSENEIKESIYLLDTFYDVEGSINNAADKLFVHKNTLQYRLKKIAERTGYDPRSVKNSSLFCIAIHFYKDILSQLHL